MDRSRTPAGRCQATPVAMPVAAEGRRGRIGLPSVPGAPHARRLRPDLRRGRDLGADAFAPRPDRGELVAEAYFHGAGPETPANLKSVTKSVTSALVGVALRDGRIRSLDDPLGAYLPEVAAAHPDKAVITLRELLTMSSGLRSVGYDAIQESDDWVATILAQPFGHRPGATFDYDTGVLQLLSAVLRRATGLSLKELARRELFGPLRAELVGWRVDPTGLELGGNDAHVRPRDLARFGELYRNGGRVDGRTLLSADYVRASVAPRSFSTPGRSTRHASDQRRRLPLVGAGARRGHGVRGARPRRAVRPGLPPPRAGRGDDLPLARGLIRRPLPPRHAPPRRPPPAALPDARGRRGSAH